MLPRVREVNEPVRLLMLALALSQTKVDVTPVVATFEQTRAPTGKCCGPAVGRLLSSPTTFHVSGVIVSVADAVAATSDNARPPAAERRDIPKRAILFISSPTVRRALKRVAGQLALTAAR